MIGLSEVLYQYCMCWWDKFQRHNIIRYGVSHQSVQVSYPSWFPSQLVTHPQPPRSGGRAGKKEKPWGCASTAQQQPKHWCVTHTVLATNGKCSTILVAMKEVDSIRGRPIQVISLQCMWYKVDFNSLVLITEMSLFTRKFALELHERNESVKSTLELDVWIE